MTDVAECAPLIAQLEALEAAVGNAVDAGLPRPILKVVLQAAVDPKLRPEAAAARAAVGAAVDAGAPPDELKAVAIAGIQQSHRDIGQVMIFARASPGRCPWRSFCRTANRVSIVVGKLLLKHL